MEIEQLIKIAGLCLDFGKIERQTYHQDRVTHETDTTHTVMLAIIAPALAENLYPGRFDIGLISQFAVVHDFTESITGDFNTLSNFSPEFKKEKKELEKKALEKIEKDFGTNFPWIHKTIAEYESLESPEARFIKIVDKILPKLVRLTSVAASSKKSGSAPFYENQIIEMRKLGHDMPELVDLLESAQKAVLELG